MTPYYQDSACTIYHGDCREILPTLGTFDLLLTDPPYPNNSGHFDESVEVAREIVSSLSIHEKMVFWNEVYSIDLKMPLVAVHIWHRTNVNGKIYEPIYHAETSGQRRRSSIIRGAAIFNGVGPGSREYLGHPTQKPVHLMQQLITLSKTSIPSIIDPFCGSGATLRAAKNLASKAIGIEIEERYCEIAAKRLAHEVLAL